MRKKKTEVKEEIDYTSLVKGTFKSIVAFIVIIMCFIFCEYYFISSNHFNDDFGEKDNRNIINLVVGESLYLGNYIEGLDNIKYLSFKHDDIFSIDSSYNILNIQEGEDELKIIYKDNSVDTLYFNSSNKISAATVSSRVTYTNKIDLDAQGGNSGATVIYTTYTCTAVTSNTNRCVNYLYYNDSARIRRMTPTTNKVNIPNRNDYLFKGYFTRKSGKGVKVIDENGYLVSTSLSISNTTLYAYWTDTTNFTDTINDYRCHSGENYLYITKCQPTSVTSAQCKYDYYDNDTHTYKVNVVNRSDLGYVDNCGFVLKKVDKSSKDSCTSNIDFNNGCLIAGSGLSNAQMVHNTDYLQSVLDNVSNRATNDKKQKLVRIPAGDFYFTWSSNMKKLFGEDRIYKDYDEKVREYNSGIYKLNPFTTLVIPRDNITLVGAGEGKTTLRPYGYCISETNCINHEGLTMFSYIPKDKNSSEYLKNVTFKNFTIDSKETKTYYYTSDGKGFHAVLCDNCHWDHVTVKNTDGTGFGVDQLINSSITNCTAIGCGKGAGINKKYKDASYTITSEDIANAPGGSGFGIGTGYANNESIYIANCRAENNTKFGFFFEHQSRFESSEKNCAGKEYCSASPTYNAYTADGFIIENSTASNNLINFGGIRADDVVLLNNTSNNTIISNNNKLVAYDVYFTEQSRNIYINNPKMVSSRFTDVKSSDWYYTAVQWAISRGITIGAYEDDIIFGSKRNSVVFTDKNKISSFAPNANISRAELMMLLWRTKGNININSNGETAIHSKAPNERVIINDGFSDVPDDGNYAGAIIWGRDKGLIQGTGGSTYSPKSIATKGQLLTMLYRLQYPVNVGNNSKNESNNKIVEWAINKKIVNSTGESYDTQAKNLYAKNLTRAEAVTMIYRYFTYNNGEYDTVKNYINNVVNNKVKYGKAYSIKNRKY